MERAIPGNPAFRARTLQCAILYPFVSFFVSDHKTFFAWAVCFPITDHLIFSREFFFYPYKIYSFIYTRLFENLKARILKSIIKWSVMGQQIAQAKKAYRPSPSCLLPQIQNESSCETIQIKRGLICMKMDVKVEGIFI